MQNKDMALRVAGIIFLLVAIMHLVRLIRGIPVTMAGIEVPVYVSLFAFVAALLLAIWMFAASKQGK